MNMNPDQRHTVGNLQPLCEVGLISVPLTRAKFVEGSVWSVCCMPWNLMGGCGCSVNGLQCYNNSTDIWVLL